MGVKKRMKKSVNKRHKAHKGKSRKSDKTRGKERKLRKKQFQEADKFVKTGLKGFDKLFEEGYGIPRGSSVLIEGGPGSGKTIFCLATEAELCKKGAKCLYMSFEEPEDRLIEHMHLLGWPVDEYIKKGLLRITRFDALDISRSVEALLSAAKKELLIEVDPVLFPRDFKPDFVVLDSLTSIASAFSGQESRFRIYMEKLFRYLEKNNMTTFLVREVSAPTHIGATYKEEGEAVSFLSDGIVDIYNVIYDSGLRSSAIEILKMRGSAFKKKIVEMKIISKKGIFITDKILTRERNVGFKLT